MLRLKFWSIASMAAVLFLVGVVLSIRVWFPSFLSSLDGTTGSTMMPGQGGMSPFSSMSAVVAEDLFEEKEQDQDLSDIIMQPEKEKELVYPSKKSKVPVVIQEVLDEEDESTEEEEVQSIEDQEPNEWASSSTLWLLSPENQWIQVDCEEAACTSEDPGIQRWMEQGYRVVLCDYEDEKSTKHENQRYIFYGKFMKQ